MAAHPGHDPEDLRARLLQSLDAQPRSARLGTADGLERLCRSVVTELDLAGATITLMVAAGPHGVAAASDPEIMSVDAAQFDVGEGPSVDAFLTGRPVIISDLGRADGSWPGFAAAAGARGIGAVYAFPMQLGAVRLGVLACYSARPRALGRQELVVCAVHAEVARDFLIDSTSRVGGTPGSHAFLADDVQIRTVVYQAQGIVMVDLGVSLVEALARLRAAAFAEGISLNQLAAEVVGGRRTLDSERDA